MFASGVPGSTALRDCRRKWLVRLAVGARRPLTNSGSHIDASHSRQPLVKGERLVRYEVNAVMRGCALDLLCDLGSERAVCFAPRRATHLCYLSVSASRPERAVVIGAIAISLSAAVLG